MPNNNMTQAAANAVNLGKGGSYSNAGNVLQDSLYDTIIFPAAVGTTTFFNVPIGTAGKTEVETNLTDPSKLPNGQTYLVQGIRIALLGNVVGSDTDTNIVLAAFYNVIQNSFFKFKIAGRDFERRIPGSQFLPTVAVSGQSVVSATLGDTPAHSYSIASGRISCKETPIPLGQLVTFSQTVTYGSAIPAVNTIVGTALTALNSQNAQLRITLEGTLTRAI